MEITLKFSSRKNLPLVKLQPYSIIYASNLVVTGAFSAILLLDENSIFAFWEHSQIEKTLFSLTRKLNFSNKSYFNPLTEKRNFEFNYDEIELLFNLAECGACASLILYIEHMEHKHCSIQVQNILKCKKFKSSSLKQCRS